MNSEEIDFTDAKMLRKKAEEQLKSKQQQDSISEEVTDLKKILHELQVHQIELEMQNEELRHTYETTESALKKYTMLFDLSPVGYFTLDSEGSICELNFKGAEILGERRFSLIDSNFKLFVSEDSKPVFNNFFRKIYTSYAKESCEVLLGSDKKSFRSVYIEGVVTEDDQKCLLSVVDISKFGKQDK
ncbi:MAG: PAS domain S-box protein [Dysgonamonadaceae bacterium]|nr:PAS domain S-box protein [Dysgonamonadaceae bacterium]MDD4247360.1 PAS domain S-box protein [Dysgonamonadaceae bacterium]